MAEQTSGGIVYTETVVHAAPQQYSDEAPYQLAIVSFEDGRRRTVRIVASSAADRVQVGESVQFVEERNGVAYYRRAEMEL